MNLQGEYNMKKLLCLLACVSLCLTGCADISLTEQEAGMISEYAAYVVLKHNRLYNNRLQEEVYETEPETTMVVATQPAKPDNTGDTQGTGSSISEEEDISALASGLGLDGFDVKYTGYETMDTYADEYFNFSATANNTLLILHFTLVNMGEQEAEADILSKQFKFRCTVNQEKRVGSQLTMLVNDLYSFHDVFAPQEEKEAVLIFQLPNKYKDAIESLSFTVKNEEENHRYSLK